MRTETTSAASRTSSDLACGDDSTAREPLRSSGSCGALVMALRAGHPDSDRTHDRLDSVGGSRSGDDEEQADARGQHGYRGDPPAHGHPIASERTYPTP